MRTIMSGLTFKLMLLVVIIGSVPLSILGGVTFFTTKANLEDNLNQQLTSAVNDSARLARMHIEQVLAGGTQHPLAAAPSENRAATMPLDTSAGTVLIHLERLEQLIQLSTLGPHAKFTIRRDADTSNQTGSQDTSFSSAVAPLSHPALSHTWSVRASVPTSDLYAPVERLNIVMWTLWFAAFFTALIIGYLFSKRLLKPLHLLLQRLQNIASQDADLTQRIEIRGEDEFAQVAHAFNRFLANLSGLVNNLSSTSLALSAQAQQSLQGAEHSQHALNQQHQQIEQVATAMNQMSATVQEVAGNTQLAAQSANDALHATQEGNQVVAQTITSIQRLAEEVEQAATVISSLKAESTRIGGILDAIRGIADQTNLLALNAAIEAARAGDAGRGFAVVADEVRTLAIRVSDATNEIQQMIQRLQGSADDAVAVMQRGQQQAGVSVADAHRTDNALQSIRAAIEQINDMNTQVATASEQQSMVAEEINKSLVTISGLAQSTSREADDIAQGSQHLHGLAHDLQRIVNRFKVAP